MKARASVSLLILAALASGCSAVQVVPWVKDGRTIGEIHKTKSGEAGVWNYFDQEQRLARTESRAGDGGLLPGSFIQTHEYEGEKRTLTRVLDTEERPALGAEGFAAIRYEFRDADAEEPYVRVMHYGLVEEPIERQGGYHEERVYTTPPEHLEYIGGSPRLWKSEFYGVRGERKTTCMAGFANTFRVEYSYLKGMGEMVYATHLDASECVVGKRYISGVNTFTRTYTSTVSYY